MRLAYSLRVRDREHSGELAAPLLLRHLLQLAQQIGEILEVLSPLSAWMAGTSAIVKIVHRP